MSSEPCVHFLISRKKKKSELFGSQFTGGWEGAAHSNRRLTKSSVSSIDFLGEIARYALKADPGDILGTSGCSCIVYFSRNHEGIRIVTKGRRREIPFGTQSWSVRIGNEVVLPYNNSHWNETSGLVSSKEDHPPKTTLFLNGCNLEMSSAAVRVGGAAVHAAIAMSGISSKRGVPAKHEISKISATAPTFLVSWFCN